MMSILDAMLDSASERGIARTIFDRTVSPGFSFSYLSRRRRRGGFLGASMPLQGDPAIVGGWTGKGEIVGRPDGEYMRRQNGYSGGPRPGHVTREVGWILMFMLAGQKDIRDRLLV